MKNAYKETYLEIWQGIKPFLVRLVRFCALFLVSLLVLLYLSIFVIRYYVMYYGATASN